MALSMAESVGLEKIFRRRLRVFCGDGRAQLLHRGTHAGGVRAIDGRALVRLLGPLQYRWFSLLYFCCRTLRHSILLVFRRLRSTRAMRSRFRFDGFDGNTLAERVVFVNEGPDRSEWLARPGRTGFGLSGFRWATQSKTDRLKPVLLGRRALIALASGCAGARKAVRCIVRRIRVLEKLHMSTKRIFAGLMQLAILMLACCWEIPPRSRKASGRSWRRFPSRRRKFWARRRAGKCTSSPG